MRGAIPKAGLLAEVITALQSPLSKSLGYVLALLKFLLESLNLLLALDQRMLKLIDFDPVLVELAAQRL